MGPEAHISPTAWAVPGYASLQGGPTKNTKYSMFIETLFPLIFSSFNRIPNIVLVRELFATFQEDKKKKNKISIE